MYLAPYTSGELRGLLPPGTLAPTYPLHWDTSGMLHHDRACALDLGPVSSARVSPEEITEESECLCLMLHTSSPPEFLALAQHSRWMLAREFAGNASDAPNVLHLHNGWSRLYSLLQNGERRNIPAIRGSTFLQELLVGEYEHVRTMEETFRRALTEHEEYHRLEQTHSGRQRLPEGTYLVAGVHLGLGSVSHTRDLSLTLLQMEHLDPFAHHLVGEASEEVLSLALLLSEPTTPNEVLEHVLLTESDTPAIREIARTLWDPETTPLATALQIARTV